MKNTHQLQQLCWAELDKLSEQSSTLDGDELNWYVGLSGGLDSSVLLHLVQQYCLAQARPIRLHAIHINHGLSPQASQWQQFCHNYCNTLGVTYVCHTLSDDDFVQANNIEAQARAGRYAAFEQTLAAGAVLLLAHHQNDQAETFLYRALRGGGSSALAAIPAQRALGRSRLVRPLLQAKRSQLEDYAQSQQLEWVEDESNQDTRFDRNFIRQQVLPLIETRWPQAVNTLSRSAHIAQETDRLVKDLAQLDLQQLALKSHWGALSIELDALLALAAYRQANVLRALCQQQGLHTPSQQQLEALLLQLAQYGQTGEGSVGIDWRAGFFKLSFGRLFCSPKLVLVRAEQLPLSTPLGRLELESASMLRLAYRAGGERLAWADGHSRSLKKQFNAWQVPSWWRDFYPLLYSEQTLVAVPGFYCHPHWPKLSCEWQT